jgi:hypothetical protein
LTGGLGLRSFGSATVGGKRYLLIIGAVVGFFAIAAKRVPVEKAWLYVGLFFLGGLTQFIGDTHPWAPQWLVPIYYLFPPNRTVVNESLLVEVTTRFYGLSITCIAVCFYLMARYGLRGLLESTQWWRLLLFVAAALMSLLGGFRTFLVLLAATIALMFLLEGLLRSKYVAIVITALLLLGAGLIGFADKLPLGMQRSLSVIPGLKISPIALYDAQASSQWRITMWEELMRQAPDYLILGKGLGMNAAEMELSAQLAYVSPSYSAEMAVLAGDYHNGPLSVQIPFGIFGSLTFGWFLLAALSALYRNWRYGDSALRTVNTFLLSLFAARILLFVFVFGGFYGDLVHFVGIVGLSISLNGGIRAPAKEPSIAPAPVRLRLPAAFAAPTK